MRRQLTSRPEAGGAVTLANLIFLLSLLAGSALISTSGVAMALPKIPDGDEDAPLVCDLDFSISAALSLEGLPVTGSAVRINASNAKIELAEPAPPPSRLCQVSYHSLAGQFQWQLVTRPSGSAVNLSGTASLTAGLTPDVDGQYRIRFTACPNNCGVPLSGGAVLQVPPAARELTFNAVSQLVLPPETEPELPSLRSTSPSPLPDARDNCAGGGGLVDPQWVTVNDWHGAQDYELLEGRVLESHISRKDSPLNHDSQDFLVYVGADPPYSRLRKNDQRDIEVEWERSHFPEVFRSTRGDRVSIVGYWVHDCGHEFKTEIHPPVMAATHRARPVHIPDAQGFGSNIFVPGIMTHLWINQDAGETTRNCSLTGLHQPSGGGGPTFGPHLCLPQTEGFNRNPINRVFEFNIYLPRDPQDILAEVGRQAPEVPLYREVLNPLGGGGPDPVLFVCPDSGPEICRDPSVQSDVTYLKVMVDLSNFSGRTYSRKIAAAWVYPAPDNWGLKRWQLRINSMDVHDDGDSRLRGDGDWRFWANTNNEAQEWTRLFDCDGCVHGTETFSGRPWETASSDPNRSLGPGLLLFPDQQIWVHTSGFEEDWIISDSTGAVSDLRPQIAQAYSTKSKCRSSGSSGCASYTLNYEILPAESPGPATLSPAGEEIYDAYTITSEEPFKIELLPLKAKRIWNLPDELAMGLDQAPVLLADTGFFSPQGVEIFALTDMSVAEFGRAVSLARRRPPEVLDRAMSELREEVDLALASPRGAEVKEELAPLLEVLPDDLREQYFSGIRLAAGTAFSYQGHLTEGGSPADGTYDFQFKLYTGPVDGDQVGGDVIREDQRVVNGIFTVQLDFGDVFDGAARWLEVQVRPGASTAEFTRLSPRQPLTPTPYAIFASRGPFWSLGGNGDTDPRKDFLGTSDGQPLVVMTSGTERFRISASGNVGIGTGDPTALLHINGTGIDNNGATAVVNVVSGNGAQQLLLDGNEIDALADGLFLNNNSAENVVLAAGGGSVGIGESNPGARLDVEGGVQAGTVGTGGIGVLGRSDDRAIVGVVGNGSCAGPGGANIYGVGGCSPGNVGVLGASDTGDGVHARTNSGNIFVGQSPNGTDRARIDNSGKGYFNGGTQNSGADFAESLRTSEDPAGLKPGDVLAIDPAAPLTVRKSTEPNSRFVAGVYSTAPAVLAIGNNHIDDSLEGEVPVAMLGVVPTRVTTENGPIHTGDLLVTSSLPGHAMKALPAVLDGVEIYPTGALLGKALEDLEEGTGMIDVLVTLK